MKVSELEGAYLDYWVARATGVEHIIAPHGTSRQALTQLIGGERLCTVIFYGGMYNMPEMVELKYSTSWKQCGPLIEKYKIETTRDTDDDGNWYWKGAVCHELPWHYGETPLIAACRCIVASVYGEEVPDE